MEELKQRLAAEEGLRFISPEAYKIPTAFDFNRLESIGLKPEHVYGAVYIILEFLRSPMIEDKFNKDQQSRREWRERTISKYTDLGYGEEINFILGHNRLRGKGLFGVIQFFTVWNEMADFKKIKSGAADKIRELKNSLPVPGQYNFLELEKKKEFVKKVEAVVLDFLNFIASGQKSLVKKASW